MKVLIVEDDLFSAKYLKKIINSLGFEVVNIIDSGVEAIEYCKENRDIDIIIMDVMLKGNKSGAEAAQIIHYDNPDISILFITAYGNEEIYSYALEAEAEAYLIKPYIEEEIKATLKLIAKKREKKRSKKEQKSCIKLVDDYSYDLKNKKLLFKDKEVFLGKNSKKLFEVLTKNIYSYHASNLIIYAIWGEEGTHEALRSLVHRLRKKTSQNIIISNRFGYKINHI